MSTPLVATHRFELQYVTSTLPHVLHAYVKLVVTAGADPTGYDYVGVNGGANAGASLAIDSLWGAIKAYYGAATTFGTTIVQVRAGTVYNPLAFYTTAVVPTGGAFVPAGQLTLTLRAVSFKRFRMQLLETEIGPGKHIVGYDTSAVFNDLEKPFTSLHVGANDPFLWIRNRGDSALGPSGSIVAATTDLNNKLRRARHIA